MANKYSIELNWTNQQEAGDIGTGLTYDPWLQQDFWTKGNQDEQLLNPVMHIIPKSINNTQYVLAAYNFRIGQTSTNANAESIIDNNFVLPTGNISYEYKDGINGVYLPDGISAVKFSDTAIANTPGNKVKVEVFFDEGWQMPNSDTTFKIDIDTYGPCFTWEPIKPSYVTSVLLTNAIWPQGSTATTNYRDISKASTNCDGSADNTSNYFDISIDDSTGYDIIPQSVDSYPDADIFFDANYNATNTGGGYDQTLLGAIEHSWNNYEKDGKQCIRIGNCAVVPINSPVSNTQPDISSYLSKGKYSIFPSSIINTGGTYASNDTDSIGSTFLYNDKTSRPGTDRIAQDSVGNAYRIVQWKIVRTSTDTSVSAKDFQVMSWDVKTWRYDTGYNPGFVYNDNSSDIPCLNVADYTCPNSFTSYANSLNVVGQKAGYLPQICQYTTEDKRNNTKIAGDWITKGFGYHYLDGVGTTTKASFNGDTNINGSCDNCWGGLVKTSHYKYEYTLEDFDEFLGYSEYGTKFTDNISGNIYIYTKPKTFKNPQLSSPGPVSSTTSSVYGNYIPHEPIYEITGNGTTLEATTTAHDRDSGSCSAGDVMFKWVTFHDEIEDNVNTVIVTGWVCPNWYPNANSSEVYLLQINGEAKPIVSEVEQPIDTSFVLESSYDNSGDITITPITTKDVTSVITKETIRGGFSNERDEYTVSGKFPNDKPTVVATIKFENTKNSSDTYTHYFTKKPSLTRESIFNRLTQGLPNSIKMVLKSKTSNNVFNFDLVYHNNVKTSIADKLKAKLHFKQLAIVTKVVDITRVQFGGRIMKSSGSTKMITVHGKPGATFHLLINKIDNFVDSNGHILHYDEISILGNNANTSISNDRGTKFAAIRKTIGKTGKYTFRQNFPKSVKETPYRLYIKCSTTGGNIASWSTSDRWTNYYYQELTQYKDPVLTLKATVGSNYALTHVDDVAISPAPSAGDDYSATYTGIAGATRDELLDLLSPSMTTDFDVTYLLNGASTKRFTQNRLPVFSKTQEYDGTGTPTDFAAGKERTSSDWTNTLYEKNGGTDIDIYGITSTLSADGGTSDGLCTISFSVRINKWGYKDLTVDLDLDKLLSTS